MLKTSTFVLAVLFKLDVSLMLLGRLFRLGFEFGIFESLSGIVPDKLLLSAVSD